MKKYVELAKKSLTDNTPVTLEELKVNKYAAYDAWTVDAAYWAYAAADAVYWAAYWDDEANIPENAEYYKQEAREAISKYEELTK